MSIYKRRYGDHVDLHLNLSKTDYQLALVHAKSLNFAFSVLGRNDHDFETCRYCQNQSPEFRAIVALNLNEEVKSYARQS
jgi:hypothetical protein